MWTRWGARNWTGRQTRRRHPNYDDPGNVLLWSRCAASADISPSCFVLFGTKWICVTWAEFQGSWLRVCLRPGSVLLCFAVAWLQSALLSHAFLWPPDAFPDPGNRISTSVLAFGVREPHTQLVERSKTKNGKKGKEIFLFNLERKVCSTFSFMLVYAEGLVATWTLH